MKHHLFSFAPPMLALALLAPGLASAQSIFLSWPGVQGTAIVPALPTLNGTIALSSYQQDFFTDATSIVVGGAYAPIPICGAISVAKPADTTTAIFMTYTMNPTVIPKLTVTFTSPGATAGTLFVPAQIVLLNAYVTGVNEVVDTSAAAAGRLVDKISISASVVQATYIPRLANGTAGTPQKVGWNCLTRTPVTF